MTDSTKFAYKVFCFRAFADSKTLSEDKRESLFKEIQGYEDMGFIVDSISARIISGKMLQM